jgi:surface polysaccharide O-acyltransferase-like enzyme
VNSPSGKTNIYAIDALRVVAILAVVLIHTSTRTLEASYYNLIAFPVSIFLNQISRFAVPLFFMISGFVLELNYDFNAGFWPYLKKRFSRIFIPYLFWSAVYYFFVYKIHHVNFIQALLTGNSSYQLYFIPSLLIFYLIFPLLHKIYKTISNRWVLILLGLIELCLLYRDYYYHNSTNPFPVDMALFNYYVFILGMFASHHQEKILELVSKCKYWLLLITVGMGVYVFWEGRSTYLATYNYLAFYSQWRPSVLVYTILLAGLLYYFFTIVTWGSSVFKALSKLSFFVFFIHVIFLETLWFYFGKYFYTRPLFDVLFFALVAGLSFAAAYLVHKIPHLSKITG